MQLSFNAVGLARLKGNEIHSGCFFLSADDAKKYFAKDELRQCGATYCAEQEGAFTDEDSGTCFWWLADNGNCYLYQAVVQSEGRVSTYGVPNQTTYVGMRPCIRVDKKAFTQKKRKAEKFDPAERDPKTFYERALNTMNEGHYARAYTLFSALFDYMDCITKEMECRQRWVEEFRRKKAAEAKTAAQNALSRADADRKAALSEQAAAKAEMDSAQAGLDAASAEKTRLTEELSQLRGLFTGKKRAQLNDRIRLTEEQIDSFRLHHKKAATACTNAGKRAAEAEKAQSEAKRKIAAAEAMMKDTSEPTREESSAFYAAVYKENNN